MLRQEELPLLIMMNFVVQYQQFLVENQGAEEALKVETLPMEEVLQQPGLSALQMPQQLLQVRLHRKNFHRSQKDHHQNQGNDRKMYYNHIHNDAHNNSHGTPVHIHFRNSGVYHELIRLCNRKLKCLYRPTLKQQINHRRK